MNDKKIELLSPAGSPKALRSAVLNGADAVYLGSHEFSARSSAVNFSEEELVEAIKYCRLRRVKVFLAVNIIFLENEIERLMRLATFAVNEGIDGFIVGDLGVFLLLKKHFPEVLLHASTQMTVHSKEGVNILGEIGFKRVVLSRELSKLEIEDITANCKTETEVFVHGALCMSYSGKCLMSSMIGKRSGNRGKCAQPCRMLYSLKGEKGYLLSPRDLCLVDDVSELIKIGVTSLKIEGRMKSPEYVAIVTSIYRKAIDKGKVTKEDKDKLKEIFCRGDDFTRGYYGNENAKTILNTEKSNDDTGRKTSAKLLKEAASTYREGLDIDKIPVNINVILKEKKVEFEFIASEVKVKTSSIMTDAPEIDTQRLILQLSKMGGTPFFVENVAVEGNIRLRVSEINEIRRDALILLTDKLLKIKNREIIPFENNLKRFNKTEKTELIPFVSNIKQARLLVNSTNKMYVPLHFINDLDKTEGLAAVLPTIIKKAEKQKVISDLLKAKKRGIEFVVCNSFDAIAIAREKDFKIIAGSGLNISNTFSAQSAVHLGAKRVIVSPELSLFSAKEIAISIAEDVESIIYGRLPLMMMENCIMQGEACGDCMTDLKDRTGAEFPVRRTGYACRNILFNSRPIYIADKGFDGYGIKYGILYFTIETPDECLTIIDKYNNGDTYEKEFTRGYLLGGKL